MKMLFVCNMLHSLPMLMHEQQVYCCEAWIVKNICMYLRQQ